MKAVLVLGLILGVSGVFAAGSDNILEKGGTVPAEGFIECNDCVKQQNANQYNMGEDDWTGESTAAEVNTVDQSGSGARGSKKGRK
jgi:hypothetical protein